MKPLAPPLLVSILLTIGCASTDTTAPAKRVKVDAGPVVDTDRARSLTLQAADRLDGGDLDRAETLLTEAVTADPGYGPAQNDLGVVYFRRGNLYPAARRFLLAAGLMPRDAEPRNSLGLVFESSGRFDDAVAYYDRARALDPTRIEYLGNAARARFRRGDRTDELRGLLAQLASSDLRPDWNQWARSTLSALDRRPTTGRDDPPPSKSR